MFTRCLKRLVCTRLNSTIGKSPSEETTVVDGIQPNEKSNSLPETEIDIQGEEYFKREQKKRMDILRENLQDEIDFHQEQVKKHQEAVDYYKKEVDEIKTQ